MSETTVKPCPFCGRPPEQSDRVSDHTDTGRIYFLACRCGSNTAHAHQSADSRVGVLGKWNNRPAAEPKKRGTFSQRWAYPALAGSWLALLCVGLPWLQSALIIVLGAVLLHCRPGGAET